MFNLQGKTAIVTGSTFGIGLGILRVLAQAGANAVMNGRRQPEQLETELNALSQFENRAIFEAADVTKTDDRKRLVSRAIEEFGRFDILVNNAGSMFDSDWDSLDEDTCRRTLDLNVTGMLMMAKLAIDHLRAEKKGGSIVNVASVNSFMAEPHSICYDTSKGAILMMTRSLAVETFKDNINVNCLCPGLVDTPLTRSLLAGDEAFKKVGEAVPNGRWCTIEECGYPVLYMVSDEGRYMTGQSLILDGGILAVQGTLVGESR